jgi:hypothetical protein
VEHKGDENVHKLEISRHGWGKNIRMGAKEMFCLPLDGILRQFTLTTYLSVRYILIYSSLFQDVFQMLLLPNDCTTHVPQPL